MLDFKRLKNDLKDIAEQIKEQKGILRESMQPRKTHLRYDVETKTWLCGTHGQLASLKSQATLLCTVRAHHRGKLHMRKRPTSNPNGGPPVYVDIDLAWQAKRIEAWYAKYTLPDLEEPVRATG